MDGQTDGQNYDSQDRASIAASRSKNGSDNYNDAHDNDSNDDGNDNYNDVDDNDDINDHGNQTWTFRCECRPLAALSIRKRRHVGVGLDTVR